MSWGYDPNWWKGNVDHEFASWSKDLAGYMSSIHVVEWDMSLFWVTLASRLLVVWCSSGTQLISYICASYKVRCKLRIYLFEGTDGVRRQISELYPSGTFQRSWEGSAYDLVRNTLLVHKGFKWL